MCLFVCFTCVHRVCRLSGADIAGFDDVSAPPLPDDLISCMQAESDDSPIRKVQWLLVQQSAVFHVLQCATLAAVSDSMALRAATASSSDTGAFAPRGNTYLPPLHFLYSYRHSFLCVSVVDEWMTVPARTLVCVCA